MYGSRVPADADNTLLEYHPERRLETSPSRPETSQLWYGHYGNLCALDAFRVSAPVIETLAMHGAVQMERGKNIFGGFKFLMARKSPQYILGCVWCVSMVPCVLSNVEGGLGWERRADTWYRDSEPSTIHPMSPFCHHHRQKYSSLNARDSSFWRLFWGRNFCFNPGDNPIELDKTLLPAEICQHQWVAAPAHAWLCCDSTDVRSFSRDLETLAAAKIYLTGSMNWMIGPMMHWTESLCRDGKRQNVAMEGWVK